MEDLGELVKVGKEIELKKPNSAVACQMGLAVAHVCHDQGGEGVSQGGVGGVGRQCSGQAKQFEMQSGQ